MSSTDDIMERFDQIEEAGLSLELVMQFMQEVLDTLDDIQAQIRRLEVRTTPIQAGKPSGVDVNITRDDVYEMQKRIRETTVSPMIQLHTSA